MSAYALPGLIFPPIEGDSSLASYDFSQTTKIIGSCGKIDDTKSVQPKPVTEHSFLTSNDKRHNNVGYSYQDRSNNTEATESDHFYTQTSTTNSSFGRYLVPSLTLENNEICSGNTVNYRDGKIQYDFSNSKPESNNHNDTVRVVVKNARIDWTQLLNVPFASATRRKEMRKRNKVINESNNTSKRRLTNTSSKDSRRERRRRFLQRIRQNLLPSNDSAMTENDNDDIDADDDSVTTMDSTSSTSSSSSSFCPEEGAIHFELSIAFHDRSYHAVRSLARIRQLYKELVESDGDSTFDDDASFYDEEVKQNDEEPMDESDDVPAGNFELSTSAMDWVPNSRRGLRQLRRSERQFERRHHQQQQQKQQSKQQRPGRRSSRIPVLPDLLQGLSSISNLRSLYALVQQNFVPAIESWFRSVFAVLTPKKSSTLTSFFLDPILLSSTTANKNTATRHQRPQLEIIPEEKYEQEE